VIPEHRRVLLIWIVIHGGFARHIPGFGITIAFRRRFRSVQMHDRAYFWFFFFRAVDFVIDRKKMARGKLICPFDQNSLPAARFDGWPGRTFAKAPYPRWLQVTVKSHFKFAHREPVVWNLYRRTRWVRPSARRPRNPRDGQGVHKFCESIRIKDRANVDFALHLLHLKKRVDARQRERRREPSAFLQELPAVQGKFLSFWQSVPCESHPRTDIDQRELPLPEVAPANPFAAFFASGTATAMPMVLG